MILHVCLLSPNRYRFWRACSSQLIIHHADWMMCCSLALSSVVDELNQTVTEEVRMYLVKAATHWTNTDCTFLNLLLSCIGNGVDLTLPFKVLGDCEREGRERGISSAVYNITNWIPNFHNYTRKPTVQSSTCKQTHFHCLSIQLVMYLLSMLENSQWSPLRCSGVL